MMHDNGLEVISGQGEEFCQNEIKNLLAKLPICTSKQWLDLSFLAQYQFSKSEQSASNLEAVEWAREVTWY